MTEDGDLHRAITLDPSRDYQPMNGYEGATMSRDTCKRCPETSQQCPGPESIYLRRVFESPEMVFVRSIEGTRDRKPIRVPAYKARWLHSPFGWVILCAR